jgi:hypothetical protein
MADIIPISKKHMKYISSLSTRKHISIVTLALLIVPFIGAAATLERQLDLGASGADVSALQSFLAQDRSIYPQGLVTGYFGTLTSAAVSNYQSRNGLNNVGRVGPLTLTAINARIGSGLTGSDVSAPTIFNVALRTGNTFATVSWNTSENAKGVVYYSTSPLTEYELLHSVTISGSVAMTDTALRTAQSVMVSGLQPNTTYYYDVYVTDASGNVSMTMQSSFRTTN